MNIYLNPKLCKSCGGKCCRGMACHYSPEDFKAITKEFLINEIDKGYISIDWLEGDVLSYNAQGDRIRNPEFDEVSKTYYLRIRHINTDIVDPSWGGTCILLTDKGCPLEFEKRPKGARMLIPKKDGCITHYNKYTCTLEWREHYEVLREIVMYYKEKQIKQYEFNTGKKVPKWFYKEYML